MSVEPDPRMDLYYAGPQTLVKIGRRRRLNLLIAGEGEPTVIFAPGGGCTTFEWGLVQHPISARTRTVAYDNAGFGFSDPGPLPRTGSAVVRDLRAALKAADIPPPYVLAGWSLGGLVMRLFAFSYPDEVVGMVMVDTSIEHQRQRWLEATGNQRFHPKSREAQEARRKWLRVEQLARAGTLVSGTPEFDEFVGLPSPELTPALNAARLAQLTSPAYYRAFRSELAHLSDATSDEVDAVRQPLGDMPLIVLSAGRLAADLQAAAGAGYAMHDEIAALSTRGERRTVDAGHAIQIEKPEAVIAAIEEVLALARAR
jgi:pimeloyl-ACP methyl ester carboxylesterase